MADQNGPNDDILSSIRRLTVDQTRLAGEFGAAGKLVLAPNLRIVRSVARPKPAQALQPLQLHPISRVVLPAAGGGTAMVDRGTPDGMDQESAIPPPGPNQPAATGQDLAQERQDPSPPQLEAKIAERALRVLVRGLVREEFPAAFANL